jgi:hypothetical protein
MPLAAMMAILIPLLTHLLITRNETTVSYFVLTALLVQFGGLFYSFEHIPLAHITKKEYEAGASFMAELRSIQGNVFFPQHGFFPLQAGKCTYANQAAVEECLASNDTTSARFWREWQNGFTNRRYDAIIVDEGQYKPYDSIPGYTLAGKVNLGANPFVTRAADALSTPRYLFLPNK